MGRAGTFWFSVVVLLGAALAVPAVAPASDEESAARCAELIGGEDVEAALEACRAAVAGHPEDLALVRTVATLEYDEGDPEAAAGLYVILLEREGWSLATARALGAALWRGGRIEEAENVLRDTAARAASADAHADLIAFLNNFDRWDEAAEAAAAAVQEFPEACTLHELDGVAKAGAGRHAAAAESFAKAVAAGCPRYRWATLGPLPEHLGEEAYRSLMDPEQLVDGLDSVDNRECELRLALLDLVATPAQAKAIADQVLNRDTLEVRYAGLGLLTDLGTAAMAQWPRLLADDDFVLRKLTLRRIREIGDPVFVPLLEAHLEAGKDTAGNLALNRLTLGELYLASGDVERASVVLQGIPTDDPLYAIGRIALADHAEASGDPAAALSYLEEALAASSEVYVDRDRLDKLRRTVGETAS